MGRANLHLIQLRWYWPPSQREDLIGQRPCMRLTGHLCSLDQWFSNFHMHWNHLDSLLDHRLLGPTPELINVVDLGWMNNEEFTFTRSYQAVPMLLIQGPLWEPLAWRNTAKPESSKKGGGQIPQHLSSWHTISCQGFPPAKLNQKPEGKGVEVTQPPETQKRVSFFSKRLH